MNLLSIETSTEICSVALCIEKKGVRTYLDSTQSGQSSSNHILPMIEALLADAELNPSQLTAIAFGRGPGSFTGLRVAAGVVQGIALAHDLPVIPVSSLQAMAQAAYQTYGCSVVMAAIDAHVQSFYYGNFILNKDKNGIEIMIPILSETLVQVSHGIMPDEPEISDEIDAKNILYMGSGWHYFQETLGKKQKIWKAGHPSARAVIDLALIKYYQEQSVSAEKALPVYLHEPYYAYNKHFNQGKSL